MIRAYRGEDFAEIIRIWNKALPEHQTNERLFIKNVLLDMNFDPEGFLIAERDGKPIGFVWAIVRSFPIDSGAVADEDRGYLNVLALGEVQDILGGVGEELINGAEAYIFSRGKKKIYVSGYTPNYVYPGQNAKYKDYLELYSKLGYKEQKRNFSIRVDLASFEENAEIEALISKRESEGYEICHLTPELIPALFSSVAPGWRHRYRRLLNECRDYERFCIIKKDGEVVGSAVWGDPYSNLERFGPYGVQEKCRGLGLGKMLLYYTLKTMKNKGLTYAWAQSTPTSGAAAAVYEKLGFSRCDEFITLAKI